MNKEESNRITDMTKQLSILLTLAHEGERVRLSESELRKLDEIHTAGEQLLLAAQAKGELTLNHYGACVARARESYWTQEELFDNKGRPLTTADANGKLTSADSANRTRSHEEAFEQLPLDYEVGGTVETLTGDSVASGNVLRFTQVSLPLARAIVQAVQDGSGQKKAVKLVSESGEWTSDEVEAAWTQLVQCGQIYKPGKVWVAEPIEDDQVGTAGLDDSVVATSETPDQALVVSDPGWRVTPPDDSAIRAAIAEHLSKGAGKADAIASATLSTGRSKHEVSETWNAMSQANELLYEAGGKWKFVGAELQEAS